MAADPRDAPPRLQLALKSVVLALMVAAIGLPINDLLYYFLLLMAAIVLAVSRVTAQRLRWAAALVVVLAAIAAKIAVDVPRIEEGHNAFLPGGADNALVTGLPPDVYRAMATAFDHAYPLEQRCKPNTPYCWQDSERPKRVYAFSFDGIYDRPAYSRRVTGIDFSDVEWQRLGFVNELAYNWYTNTNDVRRSRHRRGLQSLINPWHITMPHFVMFQFPPAFAGSRLCWRGTLLWEQAADSFAALPHPDSACRELTPDDIGKRIYGLAITPNAPLAMTLQPTPKIRLYQLFQPALALVVVIVLLFLLLRWKPRRLVLPLTFVALSLIVIAADDATLLGGLRPFDGGDDGLVYDSWSRVMVQQLLAGDIVGALKGIEPVFYFTPGSRYLRTLEHLFSGETYFGYVSLLLLLPFLVFCLFRRTFTARAALAVTLIFIAVPIGMLFGSTFYLYVKHAAHGYGDSAAAVLFLAGIVALLGCTQRAPGDKFGPALGAGLLFAVAVCLRPNLSVGAAVMLGGAGLAALWQRQGWRLAGMCIGFLPVFSMALHNWYYGGVFLLFSRHTNIAASMPMPPHAYVSALGELLHLEFRGGDLARAATQIGRMLIGPSQSAVMAPVHALAFAIIVRVLLSRRYDGWLRLTAAGALGLYTPSLFFIYSDRYPILAWLLTLLICSVWMRDEGLPWLDRRFPGLAGGVLRQPAVAWLGRRLDGLERAAGMTRGAPARASTSAA